MKKTRRLLALLLALAMVFALAACGGGDDPSGSGSPSPSGSGSPSPTGGGSPSPSGDPGGGDDPAPGGLSYDANGRMVFTTVEPITPETLGSGTVKWSEEETADGWMLVTNEGGETLGYHPDSGLSLIQVDGFAFKDLDKDGELDGYEDWRNDAETRAADLASQLSGEEMGPLTTHGGWGAFGDTYDHENAYVLGGGRGGVTRSSHSNGNTATAVSWTNSLQELCESLDWGIPASISVDPSEISNIINTMSLASTMDVELAQKIGEETAKMYRAVGITILLGPQVDLASPIMQRGSGTYGEDPALTRDIAQAYVNGLQSTYAEDGTDLGWGDQSVYCMTKHYAGAGGSEGGRDDHRNPGRYSVFPGDNFEAHLIAYHDGTFDLPGLTEQAGVMMQYAINIVDDEPLGGEFGAAYNEYMTGLLQTNWKGFSITDWGIITGPMATWGVEEMTTSERIMRLWMLGTDHLGLQSNMEEIADAYAFMVDELGQDEADQILREAVYEFFRIQVLVGLYENPYLDTAYALETVWSASAIEFGNSTREKAVVMLKNDGTVQQATGSEKKTVYIPSTYTAASTNRNGEVTPASINPSMDVELLSQYFNVITDTVGDPSGEDGGYTEADIIRPSAAELATCDFALVSMRAPFTSSTVVTDEETGTDTWYAPSIQYAAYTATTAREVSIGGLEITENINDGYTVQTVVTQENRSYRGNTTAQSSNYRYLELLQTVEGLVGDIPVVVSMTAGQSMVWSEVEPLADVILLSYNNERTEAVAKILAGQLEPYGLLPVQQAASMEAVEAQLEDVPRDMECYVDANGNTYDFAFGMNWSGVINDERVRTYSADPLTNVANPDFTLLPQ